MPLNLIEADKLMEEIMNSLGDSPEWKDFTNMGFNYTDKRRTECGVLIGFKTEKPPELRASIQEVARTVLGRELTDGELKIETGRNFMPMGGMER